MDNMEIFSHVDHTLLKPDASWQDIEVLCEQATMYGAASVCVAPAYVSRIRQEYGSLPISAVVGFPFGYSTVGAKAFEARQAVDVGASEIDMMINLGDVRNKAFHRIMAEISAVKKAIDGHLLKVIMETCYLNEAEKIELCHIVGASGADYIQTSTGYGTAGATLEDTTLFRQHLPKKVKIKAAGGIRTREALLAFLDSGADRIGTSTAMAALFR